MKCLLPLPPHFNSHLTLHLNSYRTMHLNSYLTLHLNSYRTYHALRQSACYWRHTTAR
jgi:hypothetical protein